MSESKALALAGATHVPTDEEIAAIGKAGKQVLAAKQEMRELEQAIAGMEWGSGNQVVKGASFSPVTRAMFAHFCFITGANPLYHIDVLGGKPWHNSNYWADRCNSDPLFIRYVQRDLSPSVETTLRDRATRLRDVARQLPQGEEQAKRLLRGLELDEEADDIAMARATWSAPEWAQVVIETTIHRFINAAPMERIRSGEIEDWERYVITVPECNWAGGRPKAKSSKGYEYDPDPIGNQEPAKTARTRSLRRAAAKALPVVRTLEAQIKKAEEAIEAEWTIIGEDQREARAQLPNGGPQAIAAGSGEATAANAAGAAPLPVEDHTGGAAEWDKNAALRTFFANLKAAGIDSEKRADWAREHGLPESISSWTQEEHAKATKILVGPERRKFVEGCKIAGVNAEEFALETLEGVIPTDLDDFRRLNAALSRRMDAEEES